MADLAGFQFFTEIGENSTGTARTGTSSALVDVPINADGISLGGSLDVQAIPTDHNASGNKYRILGRRNQDEGSITTPFYPERAELLLNAAIAQESTGLPSYHQVRHWWTSSVVGGSGTGRDLLGVLFKTCAFSVDRNAGGHVELSLGAMLNQDVELTSAAPTPSWPTDDPYVGNRVLIDLEVASTAGAFSAWTGDNADIKSFSFNYDNGMDVQRYAPNTTASLNQSWTKAFPGAETITSEIVLYFSQSAYIDYHRANDARKFRYRIAGVASNPSGSTTSSDTEVAGTNVVFTVASTTGFATGDIVLIEDSANSKFAVGTATVDASALTITIDTTDVALDGSGTALTLKNTAWEIKVDELDLTAAPVKGVDGNAATITLSLEGALASSPTTADRMLTVKAYDDDST